MGFNQEIRRAQDDSLPIGRRYVALRSAVRMFSPNGFNATFDNLSAAVSQPADEKVWAGDRLTEAAGLLDQSRDLYLGKKRLWDQERSRNKSRGARSATPSEEEAHNHESWFDAVSATSRQRFKWVSVSDWVSLQDLKPEPFGPELAADLEVVRSQMPASDFEPSGKMIAHYGPYVGLFEPANVVAIPNRIYSAPIPALRYQSLSATQKVMADCLYSRSHDGFLRQRSVKKIVQTEELWVIPFVVCALGDYVVEVVQEVASGLSEIDMPHSWQDSKYRLFADHNADLLALVRQRALSYLDCYYTHEFSATENPAGPRRYPALTILDSIGQSSPRNLFRLSTNP